MSGGESQVPVFVFPTSLHFYLGDPSTHKQILTLYNPYDFLLTYKVLSTAPQRYSVVEPEGVLKPRCCIDLVIRHVAVNRGSVGQVDKFRIQISEHRQKELLGKKDVIAQLLGTVGPGDSSPEFPSFQGAFDRERGNLPSPRPYSFPAIHRQDSGPIPDPGANQYRTPNALVILAGLLCVAALSMPSQGDSTSLPLPPYLHMTLPQKLVAAYVLGLITMLLFRN